MSRKISIGFSSCPNDTYIFDAMVNQKIDTAFQYQVVMADVEELNQLASEQVLDVTKLSYSALFHLEDHYTLLDSGSALGKGVGPLLISGKPRIQKPEDEWKVVLPGKMTTAHLLFTLAYPMVHHKTFMLFSEIEDAVLNGSFDGGVIIHENRFTYKDKGLFKIKDLGEHWESKYQVPIPLGGIAAAHKRLDDRTIEGVQGDIKKSIEFAFKNPSSSSHYVAMHAQEMAEDVRRKHIQTYVNHYSLNLGNEGHEAINELRKASSQIILNN